MEEVRRHNDVRLIHVKGYSTHGGNNRADKLARWGTKGPLFHRLRPGGGEGASQHGPRTTRCARPLRREALQMRRKGVIAEPPLERALRLTWRAWCGVHGALLKMMCVVV
jgi:hypothetical protein